MKPIKRRPTPLTVLAILLLPAVAAAQESSDDPVDDLNLVNLLNVQVSTATKTSESIADAPAVITVITREQIQRWGYQSVAEVLSHTLGFYLIDDHILPNASVRGMSGGLGSESGVIKVMIDGRSVAYRTTSGNWLGVELVPLGSVQQIEIIRGPASALYGADAFLGVVNIITLKPEDVRPIRVRSTVGLTATNPSGKVDAVGGGMLGPFDLLLGVAGERGDRSGLSLPEGSPAPSLPGDIGTRTTSLNLRRESLVMQGRLGLRDEKSGHVIVSAYGSGLRRGGDFAHWAQLTNRELSDGTDAGTVVALQQLRLDVDTLLHAASTLDLAVQGSYFQGGTLPGDRIDIGNDLFYVERNQSYRGFDSTVEARWTPTNRFNAIAGLETVYDRERLDHPDRIDRESGIPIALDEENAPGSKIDLTNVGAYLSVNTKVWDPWLKLTGGLRYDRHSHYGHQLTGRVGATSRWSEALVAKLLYGSAFKAPSPYLLYAAPLRPGDVIGSPDLLPQLVHTLEYQMSYAPTRYLSLSSGVAASWLLDKAEFTQQGINQTARNIASQRTLSWENRASYQYYDDIRLYGAFEWVWSERDLGREGYVAELVGTENVVYPDWIGRTGVLVGIPSPIEFPLELGSEALVVGERRAADSTLVETGSDVRFGPYLMLDASLSTRELYLIPGHETRFALRARNLLLATGPDPGPAGFEYPLRPGEIFFEIEHLY